MSSLSSKKRSASFVEDSDDSAPAVPAPAKRSKTGASAPDGTDDDGNPFWEVSSPRTL